MKDIIDQIRTAMCDAGCSEAEIADALRECRTGDPAGLLHQLRKCRCRRMEELHESQRRVDRLDYLIRETKQSEWRILP